MQVLSVHGCQKLLEDGMVAVGVLSSSASAISSPINLDKVRCALSRAHDDSLAFVDFLQKRGYSSKKDFEEKQLASPPDQLALLRSAHEALTNS